MDYLGFKSIKYLEQVVNNIIIIDIQTVLN